MVVLWGKLASKRIERLRKMDKKTSEWEKKKTKIIAVKKCLIVKE